MGCMGDGGGLTNDPREWLKQPSLSREDLRYHVVVHASHQEQRWEPTSASLFERNPEVIPDVDDISSLMKRSRDTSQVRDV
jgi:hypothetical protein